MGETVQATKSNVERSWKGYYGFIDFAEVEMNEMGVSVGRGSWFVGSKSWVVGSKSWVVGRGSWVIDWKGSALARSRFLGIPSISKQTLSSLQQQTIHVF